MNDKLAHSIEEAAQLLCVSSKLLREELAGGRAKVAYSIEEAAKLLSISSKLLREEIASGRVKTVNIGRRKLVPRWAIEERVSPVTSVEDLMSEFERTGAI